MKRPQKAEFCNGMTISLKNKTKPPDKQQFDQLKNKHLAKKFMLISFGACKFLFLRHNENFAICILCQAWSNRPLSHHLSEQGTLISSLGWRAFHSFVIFLFFPFPNRRRPELLASHKLWVPWGFRGAVSCSLLLVSSRFIMRCRGIRCQLWDLPSLRLVIRYSTACYCVYKIIFMLFLCIYWNLISHALALRDFLFNIPELLQQLQFSSHSCVFPHYLSMFKGTSSNSCISEALRSPCSPETACCWSVIPSYQLLTREFSSLYNNFELLAKEFLNDFLEIHEYCSCWIILIFLLLSSFRNCC